MKSPKLYIVTGVKDNWKHTSKLLACLKSQTYKKFEVVVVDDGSIDGTKLNVFSVFSKAIVIEGDGNLWWTGCMYKAVEYVLKVAERGDYILTINNDCTVDKDYLEKMFDIALHYPNAIIGSLVVDSNDHNNIVDSGAKINWLRGKITRAGYRTINDISADQLIQNDIDTLTTRGTLYPLSIFKEIGNFDMKHLPHYVSDFEFACRAKKNGYKLIIANNCIVYNDIERTGFSGPSNSPITFAQYKKILFGRKSQVNIVDHFYLIYLCCPWYYQPINYVYLVAKLLYVTSFLKYFYLFRWPLVKLRNVLLK